MIRIHENLPARLNLLIISKSFSVNNFPIRADYKDILEIEFLDEDIKEEDINGIWVLPLKNLPLKNLSQKSDKKLVIPYSLEERNFSFSRNKKNLSRKSLANAAKKFRILEAEYLLVHKHVDVRLNEYTEPINEENFNVKRVLGSYTKGLLDIYFIGDLF